MVVICPKCKVRLKVPDEKIAPGGTRFKCPKCQAVLMVKRPAPKAAQPEAHKAPEPPALDPKKVMVAHAEASVADKIRGILERNGFQALTAADGVQAMVQTMRERPFLILVDVALPKIYGFEVVKRLKARPETNDIKAVLLSSIYDPKRCRREPASLYGADDYLDEHRVDELLMEKIRALQAPAGRPETKEPAPEPPAFAEQKSAPPPPATAQPAAEPPALAASQAHASTDAMAEKARRLARTIVADINLYSPEKVEKAVREGSFYDSFSAELKEGRKLYDMRIPAEVRQRGDFFKEAIDNFIESRKKALGI